MEIMSGVSGGCWVGKPLFGTIGEKQLYIEDSWANSGLFAGCPCALASSVASLAVAVELVGLVLIRMSSMRNEEVFSLSMVGFFECRLGFPSNGSGGVGGAFGKSWLRLNISYFEILWCVLKEFQFSIQTLFITCKNIFLWFDNSATTATTTKKHQNIYIFRAKDQESRNKKKWRINNFTECFV